MDKNAHRRSYLALMIALAVVVIIYFLIPSIPDEPRGILLPTTKAMSAASPDQVTFYNSSLGYAYKKLGYINVQYHSVSPSPSSEEVLANYVKQLAATVGGNGVVISLFGHTLPGEVSRAQASYVFRGEVVYIVPNI